MYHMVTGQNPPGHVPPGHLPQGHVPPGHLPPGHLPPGHLPPRTHTPRSLTPWTLTPQDTYPPDFEMPYLVHALCFDNILQFEKHLFCRIEEGWLTEHVVLFIGHYSHYKTMSFLFNSVLYFPHNIIIIWSRKKKGE